ncbi:hypothetical protein VFPPC_12222 [Pochonia chlamydosporia 170]|uniref:DUF7587 domain-containing protein n=1 Tax=Pochonia chlamydosporia 170 TaxID=1380566 RepID=A0A179EYI4_METCM|nr:hypothetical protein VFPPC_12222 [Pochonia chlamydosporia 170]OAQ58256.1 hypothetical protein VFPPC_12222 [Pochonia chlamydosporia 170]
MTRYRYRFFYRVEDEDSQAVTILGEGISAMGTARIDFGAIYGRETEVLRWNLEQHLHWNSDYRSPFISAYEDEDVAFDIAYGRKKKGKNRVSVTVIDVSRVYGEVEFREMRPLAKRLGIWIPEKAYNNSKHEWVFLHDIPDDAIVDVHDI